MQTYRTSIALATYQGGRHLGAQLESFLTQTRLPDEVVVSDDHSTDDTLAIVEKFAERAPFPVVLVRNIGTNGIVSNFENAVRHCKNDIILFSDQDDCWLPQHIERLAALLESNERVLAVSSNSIVADEDLRPKGYTLEQSERYRKKLREAVMRFPDNQLELVARQRILAGHGLAFRKSLVPLVVPFSATCLHDTWVYILAAVIGRVAYLSEPLTLYRTHTAQQLGGEKKPIQAVAAKLRKRSALADEAPIWRDILERLRAFPQLARNFNYSERVLIEKLEFVERRSRNRRSNLPRRAITVSLELLRGRYHRLGRGFTTYGRDLLGNR